jgi:hypothetical protein
MKLRSYGIGLQKRHGTDAVALLRTHVILTFRFVFLRLEAPAPAPFIFPSGARPSVLLLETDPTTQQPSNPGQASPSFCTSSFLALLLPSFSSFICRNPCYPCSGHVSCREAGMRTCQSLLNKMSRTPPVKTKNSSDLLTCMCAGKVVSTTTSK